MTFNRGLSLDLQQPSPDQSGREARPNQQGDKKQDQLGPSKQGQEKHQPATIRMRRGTRRNELSSVPQVRTAALMIKAVASVC